MSDKADKTVEIVMATYNGGKYINEQIASIIYQDYRPFRLIVGDDASQDDTAAIVARWQKRYPDLIFFHPFDKNVGVVNNFYRLLELTGANYLMFADQDDIWLPNKISLSMTKMEAMEQAYGSDTPLLVHTDLKVVDDTLDVIAPSWRTMFRIHPRKSYQLPTLLIRTCSLGCTQLFNRTLLDLATPLVPEVMHDHWLAMVVALFGRFGDVEQPTVLYRQHDNNFFGAIPYNLRWLKRCMSLYPQIERRIVRSIVRTFVFYKRFYSLLTDEQCQLLEAYIQLKNHSLTHELCSRFKYGFWSGTLYDNIALLYGSYKMGALSPKYRLL